MKHIVSTILILHTILILCPKAYAQSDNKICKEKIWKKISHLFIPPDLYKNDFGTYRNPLLFYNGDTVKNQQDWISRRKEIKQRWNHLMGDWPPLIKENKPEFLDTVKVDNYTRYTIRFLWTPTEYTIGYLSIPDYEGPKPAVISVFYEPETSAGIGGNPNRDFAHQLAKRGFVTLSIGTSEATKNQTYSIFHPDLYNAAIQPLSMLAYAAANACELLADIEDVDSEKIGIIGHSFGGKWAMFASCLYDKFACGVWSDPGIVFDESIADVNYWEPYYLGYHAPPWRKRGMITDENPAKGLYIQLRRSGYDLHELHALMAPRPFLVSGGTSDPVKRWIPLNSTISINNLLGFHKRVAMDNRLTHAPTSESNELIYLFFEYFLK